MTFLDIVNLPSWTEILVFIYKHLIQKDFLKKLSIIK